AMRTIPPITGIIASAGCAIGPVFCFDTLLPTRSRPGGSRLRPPSQEIARLRNALSYARASLQNLLDSVRAKASGDEPAPEYAVLSGQAEMLADAAFIATVEETLRSCSCDAETALRKAITHVTDALSATSDEYLRARAADIRDAFSGVFDALAHDTTPTAGSSLPTQGIGNSTPHSPWEPDFSAVPPGSIVVAAHVQPAHALRLHEANIAGLVTEGGSVTSHVAIMARAWSLPLLVSAQGCKDVAQYVLRVRQTARATDEALRALLDAESSGGKTDALGTLTVNPDVRALRTRMPHPFLTVKHTSTAEQSPPAACVLNAPLRTYSSDGIRFEVGANIVMPQEACAAAALGAAGIGLFRSEFLLFGSDRFPDEETQCSAYTRALQAMRGLPVVLRTFDLGADKLVPDPARMCALSDAAEPCAHTASERNPLLGLRGIRYCLAHPELLKVQLRAMLRAGACATCAEGTLRILIPMVSRVEEIHAVADLISEVADECARAHVSTPDRVALGIMIETPASALMAADFAPHVDFFSIGTNDLTQYVFAADRENEQVSSYADYFHPALLRLIQHVIHAHRHLRQRPGISFGEQGIGRVVMCGAMAEDETALFLLAGLGLRALSVPSSRIETLHTFLSRISVSDAEHCARAAVQLSDAQSVRTLIEEHLRTAGITLEKDEEEPSPPRSP
ncbi:PEP-utilizing enzyme, partial [Treponema pallidum]